MDGVEIGMRARLTQFDMQLSLFSMDQKNGVYQNSNREYLTGASTSHNGVEYSINYSPAAQLSFHFNGTYSTHLYENSPQLLGDAQDLQGLDIDTAPRQSNRLSGRWHWQPESYAFMAITQMSSYYLDPENKFEYEGHAYADVGVLIALSKNLQLQLSVKNATNQQYAERADVAFGEYRYFPSMPRRFYASMQYQF